MAALQQLLEADKRVFDACDNNEARAFLSTAQLFYDLSTAGTNAP